jgi:hypothetical protein
MSTSSKSPLVSILEEAWSFSQQNRPFLAVFDLDSTLLDLTLRVSTIVDDFAEDPVCQAAHPEECRQLKNVKILPTDWGLETPLRRAGMKPEGKFFQALQHYWHERFFSDSHMKHDEPLPGAVEYVQELHLSGAHIMYLSARDIPRMGAGTEISLQENHFPLAPGTAEIVLKPEIEMDDAQFKLEVLQGIEHKYERIWLFENEPVNINLIAKHCPQIGMVFIESTHSGREQVSVNLEDKWQDELHSIRHFEVNLAEFRQMKKNATLP